MTCSSTEVTRRWHEENSHPHSWTTISGHSGRSCRTKGFRWYPLNIGPTANVAREQECSNNILINNFDCTVNKYNDYYLPNVILLLAADLWILQNMKKHACLRKLDTFLEIFAWWAGATWTFVSSALSGARVSYTITTTAVSPLHPVEILGYKFWNSQIQMPGPCLMLMILIMLLTLISTSL